MKHLILAACVVLTGCASGAGGGTLIPVKAVGSVSGDLSGPQVFIAGVPVNALLKVHGNLTYTVQPFPPYLTYDGDWNYIIEPAPGMDVEAQNAVLRGDVLIRHEGQPSTLNAPGSIAAYKAAIYKSFYPDKAAAPALPAVPAPSKPITCCDPTDPTSPCFVPTCSR